MEKKTGQSGQDRIAHDRQDGGNDPANKPDWAAGLRRLYDSVVEEPLPDSFKDLLSKLDDTGQ
ncbi:MAG: NepR family anti-sigma factor [Novosphingobium sp.]|nr:NepR family anti-sigma factor [Novosphingobium sp.]